MGFVLISNTVILCACRLRMIYIAVCDDNTTTTANSNNNNVAMSGVVDS